MIFGAPLAEPVRLRTIDETNQSDHYRLEASDKCHFLFEYTSGESYSYSLTNSLILNLKKKPSQSSRPGYHHKAADIAKCSRLLRETLNPKWLENGTLVPVPPSKQRTHPDYDDRMSRICRGISSNHAHDVRELVVQTRSMDAAHESPLSRPTIADLLSAYQIDEVLCSHEPTSIAIFDDVLTAGTHFKAMQSVLRRRFPSVPIVGIFIARRVFPKLESELE